MNLTKEDHLKFRTKIAQLRLSAQYGTQKLSFVASPQTSQAVQEQAQQTGQAPNIGSPTQAVSPSGVTLDEVVQMLDQFYSETISGLQQLQTLITQLQTMPPQGGGNGGGEGKGGGGGENFKALNDRVAKLEQMLAGQGAVAPSPVDQAAAQAPSPGQGDQSGAGQQAPGQMPIGNPAPPAPVAQPQPMQPGMVPGTAQ